MSLVATFWDFMIQHLGSDEIKMSFFTFYRLFVQEISAKSKSVISVLTQFPTNFIIAYSQPIV